MATITSDFEEDVDLYAFFNLPANATADQIKQKYKKLSLITHPDKIQPHQSSEHFKKVQTAYRILSTPIERLIYD